MGVGYASDGVPGVGRVLVWVTGAGFSWVVLKFWFALALAWFFSRGWFSLLSFFLGPGGLDSGVRHSSDQVWSRPFRVPILGPSAIPTLSWDDLQPGRASSPLADSSCFLGSHPDGSPDLVGVHTPCTLLGGGQRSTFVSLVPRLAPSCAKPRNGMCCRVFPFLRRVVVVRRSLWWMPVFARCLAHSCDPEWAGGLLQIL